MFTVFFNLLDNFEDVAKYATSNERLKNIDPWNQRDDHSQRGHEKKQDMPTDLPKGCVKESSIQIQF